MLLDELDDHPEGAGPGGVARELLALAWLVVAMRTVLFALDGQPRSEGQPRSSAPTRSPASDTAAARTSATSAAVSVRSGARKRSA